MVGAETTKLKFANTILCDDVMHAVSLSALPSAPLHKLYI